MNIPNKDEELLRNVVAKGRRGTWVDNGDMTQQQANLVVNLINDELAYRAATGTEQEDGSVELEFNTVPAGTNSTPDSERDALLASQMAGRLASLPDNVREWLGNIRDHSDMGIINILNNPAVTQDMTEQQAAYFRLRLKQELRRRGIDPSEAQPSSTSTSQSGGIVFDELPQRWQNWFANISNHSDRTIQQNLDAINDPENSNSNNDLSAEQRNFVVNAMTQELQRRGVNQPHNSWADLAADNERQRREREQLSIDMQNQLVNRDDPVTSNDPDSQAHEPEPQDGPGLWMVGNHTYGRETFRANNKDAAIQAYAERNGITDIDAFKAERSFVAQLMSPDQGELDLREMRRLAGLV